MSGLTELWPTLSEAWRRAHLRPRRSARTRHDCERCDPGQHRLCHRLLHCFACARSPHGTSERRNGAFAGLAAACTHTRQRASLQTHTHARPALRTQTFADLVRLSSCAQSVATSMLISWTFARVARDVARCLLMPLAADAVRHAAGWHPLDAGQQQCMRHPAPRAPDLWSAASRGVRISI